MDFSGFYHEEKSRYACPIDLNTLHIRLRTGRGTVQKARLIIFEPFEWSSGKLKKVDEIPMVLERKTYFPHQTGQRIQ
jgi:hypothetical protein